MKIRIEAERCKGHQNCVRAAPQLFEVSEDGSTQLKGCGEVHESLEESALLAADNCPEFAIEIEDDLPPSE
ncbi:ferredoxin [Paraburkholderia sp. RL17-347-BIC-D]|uniref:ferredoxin n=1 Tax=Paraburkholderia sp. RL17-347-BIC-D TaxID=3031632 RepID=UPI0038B9EDD8